MCVIIDANVAAGVFAKPTNPDFKPLIDWIVQKDGKMVFGGTKNTTELNRVASASKRIREWARSGKAIQCRASEVDQESERVKAHCLSDDPHVIALARLTRARTLCSCDQRLHTDFKNLALVPPPKGIIYQNGNHVHALRHTIGCPG